MASHDLFYKEHNISPVAQDISDIRLHFQRRDSLFQAMKVVPSLLRGREILEFGPGSGHNSLYTASLGPSRYDLVDGNPKGVSDTRMKLSAITGSNFEIYQTRSQDFATERKYDLIWAEGCVPHQGDPIFLLNHMSQFIKDRGIFLVTAVNGISYLSEIFRRLIRERLFPAGEMGLLERVELIKPYFAPHLAHLKGMSRPVDDWLLDNLLQPLSDRKLLSIPEIVTTLADRFDVLGTCPQFIRDWRWYKEIVGPDRGYNASTLKNYYQVNLNLIDYRFEFEPHSRAFGEELEYLSSRSWEMMTEIERGRVSAWPDFFRLSREIMRCIQSIAPETAISIKEGLRLLEKGELGDPLPNFSSWWGRGQQYISLLKLDESRRGS